jgi:hypothetical protein
MKKALFGLLCALSIAPIGIETLSAQVTPSFDNGVKVEKTWYGRGWGAGYGRGWYGRGWYGSSYSYGYPYSGYGYGYGSSCGCDSCNSGGCCGGCGNYGWW